MSKSTRKSKKSEAMINQIIALSEEGLNIHRISKVQGMPCRQTIHRWIKKDEEFQRRLYSTHNSHHLKKSGGRPYQMRVTIGSSDANKVGKRITIPLCTHDLEEAKARRDMYIQFLINRGLEIVGYKHRQRRKGTY